MMFAFEALLLNNTEEEVMTEVEKEDLYNECMFEDIVPFG